MEITNFKLIDYLNQPLEVIESYIIALRYIKPIETKQDIYHMTLGEVEMIKGKINSGIDVDLIEVVSKVQNCTEEDAMDFPIIEFFSLINSIRKQVEVINQAEENAFTPNEVDVKWEMVEGAKKMAKFGIYNTLEKLSGGDALKYKDYMDMAYSEVFTILLMRKTADDINKEMEKIKTIKDV